MTPSPRDLLVSTFSVYRAHFWLLIGYASWMLLPEAVFLVGATFLPKSFATGVLIGLTILIQLFVGLWLVICIMSITRHAFHNHPIDPNEISVHALRRIQSVLGVVFLQTLIILGGILLFIIPGIIFWVWYSMGQVAAALDGQRPMEALATSRALVVNQFWAVLWRLMAGPFVIGLIYAFVLGSVLVVIATVFGQDLATVFSEQPPFWAQLIEAGADVFMVPLLVIYSVLLYEHLKSSLLEKPAPVA